jgi:hypothetical protein
MQQVEDSSELSLSRIFQRALAAESHSQEQWQVTEGGNWSWQPDGVRLSSDGADWSALSWQGWDDFISSRGRNFLVETTVSGKAQAAGLSFGPYKDFLTSLDPTMSPRHLQLEVDADAGCWAFRIDGRLMNRCWWDSGVEGIEDLLNGTLTLKVQSGEDVLFHDLAFHTLSVSCQLTVIITCHRFLQRLRLALRNWCYQNLPSGAYEVLVVNPQSPDGTHEHIAAVARSFPQVRVREIAVDANLTTNKGAMINRAFAASRGEWIWLTDADCLFAPDCAASVLPLIQGRQDRLFYGQRRYLTATQTDALLAGRVDGVRDFGELAENANLRPPENSPWGYTQIVHRSTLQRLSYDEKHNHFAHTDGVFAETCRRQGVTPLQLEGLFCLHLEHPFSWYGTRSFL